MSQEKEVGVEENQGNSKGGDKSKYKCFKYNKTGHFKKDRLEVGDNDDSAQFEVASEDFEHACSLDVSC